MKKQPARKNTHCYRCDSKLKPGEGFGVARRDLVGTIPSDCPPRPIFCDACYRWMISKEAERSVAGKQ